MKQIGHLWRGELTLENAFWNWAVFGGLTINIFTTALSLFFIMMDHPIPALVAGYVFSVPYNIMALVGVWRSADRYGSERLNPNLVRIVTLIGVILFSVT